LIVDAYGKLAFSAAFERLKAITRRRSKIVQHARLVEQTKFSQGRRLNIRRQFPTSPTLPDERRFIVSETPDHGGS